MKAAVFSDIHDNTWNLRKVLIQIQKEKCEAIIFCGDYCAPSTVKLIANLKIPTHAVFGNVDGAQYEVTLWLEQNAPHYQQFKHLAEFKLGNRKMAATHYPEFALGLAHTGQYDVVFHGHTHEVEQRKVGKTLLANPGEIHGGKGKCTFGIYDTKSRRFRIVKVE